MYCFVAPLSAAVVAWGKGGFRDGFGSRFIETLLWNAHSGDLDQAFRFNADHNSRVTAIDLGPSQRRTVQSCRTDRHPSTETLLGMG
jgi:hypothetical protein